MISHLVVWVLALQSAARGGNSFELGTTNLCKGAKEIRLDIDRVPILINDRLYLNEYGMLGRIEIRKEHVRVYSNNDMKDYRQFDMSYLWDGNSNLDVDVYIALLRSKPVIYWRETIKHNSFRFGLAQIKNYKMEAYCKGIYGVTISH